MVFLRGYLFERTASDGGVRLLVGDGRVAGAALEAVVFFDEQPVRLGRAAPLAARLARHPHQHPLAFELRAVEFELQFAVTQGGGDVLEAGLRLPSSLVPHHHRATAVLALRNDALKAAVLHRVVFDLYGETAVFGVEAGAFRHSPALEHAVPAQTEVVVQVAGGVLLDDEGECGGRLGLLRGFASRLCGHLEVAHGAVAGELLFYFFGGLFLLCHERSGGLAAQGGRGLCSALWSLCRTPDQRGALL